MSICCCFYCKHISKIKPENTKENDDEEGKIKYINTNINSTASITLNKEQSSLLWSSDVYDMSRDINLYYSLDYSKNKKIKLVIEKYLKYKNRELSDCEIEEILSFNIIINTILSNYKPEDNDFLYYCFDLIDLVRANIQKM